MNGFGLGPLAGAPWPGLVVAAGLGGALLAWRWATRTREPAAAIRPVPHAYPNRDPVSVAVDALTSHAYGRLLDRARAQLVSLSVHTTGRTPDQLPGRWAMWRRRASPTARRVRRLERRLEGLRARARWRQRAWWPRADVWRSPAVSEARFRGEISRFLTELGRALPGPEGRR